MNQELSRYFSIGEAISVLLYPHLEVVIHDLSQNKIAAICNNFSKRKVGDDSLLNETSPPSKFPDRFPLYVKENYNGKKIKSISATLKDANGKPIGLLCMNLDLSKWEEMHLFLKAWIEGVEESEKPEILFKDDWREKINSYLSSYLKKHNTTLKALNKDKKRELILSLHKEGAFQAKNAASYIGEILELSRATIYNYLRS